MSPPAARQPRGEAFVEFVLDQLSDVPGVAARRMFGGHGLYLGTVFFGIVDRGRLYFRTDERTRALYRGHGSKPFRVSAKMTLKSYFEVPQDVLEDRDQLALWMRAAAESAPPR